LRPCRNYRRSKASTTEGSISDPEPVQLTTRRSKSQPLKRDINSSRKKINMTQHMKSQEKTAVRYQTLRCTAILRRGVKFLKSSGALFATKFTYKKRSVEKGILGQRPALYNLLSLKNYLTCMFLCSFLTSLVQA
jgi:hypothetical protein